MAKRASVQQQAIYRSSAKEHNTPCIPCEKDFTTSRICALLESVTPITHDDITDDALVAAEGYSADL